MKSPAVYEIEVNGCLDESWSEWFAGMKAEPSVPVMCSTFTRLTEPIQDQAMLRSILDHMFDLNIKVISVHPIDTAKARE
jgi:hypothetical protein